MLKQQIEEEKKLRDKKEAQAKGDFEIIDEDRPDLKLEGFSFDMVFQVFFRDRFMKRGNEDLMAHSMTIEHELHHLEIHYESISVKDGDIPYV